MSPPDSLAPSSARRIDQLRGCPPAVSHNKSNDFHGYAKPAAAAASIGHNGRAPHGSTWNFVYLALISHVCRWKKKKSLSRKNGVRELNPIPKKLPPSGKLSGGPVCTKLSPLEVVRSPVRERGGGRHDKGNDFHGYALPAAACLWGLAAPRNRSDVACNQKCCFFSLCVSVAVSFYLICSAMLDSSSALTLLGYFFSTQP